MNKQLTLSHELTTLIHELIRAKEREIGKMLTIDDFDFLAKHTSDFVKRAIDKFIRGSAEHGDDFQTGVPHLDEAFNEITDLLFYIAAARDKVRKYDERYK